MYTLIIGGNGLIGSSIAQSLEKKNIIVCDLKKKILKESFFILNINNEKSFKKLFVSLKREKLR